MQAVTLGQIESTQKAHHYERICVKGNLRISDLARHISQQCDQHWA